MKIFLIPIIYLLSFPSHAFNDYYDCIETGGTSISWSYAYKKYSAKSYTETNDPITLKITDLNTDTPYLSGQSTTKLIKSSSSGDVLWLLEYTPGGTVVTWALFEKNVELNPSAKTLLISSKSYDMAGAANFTTIYECNP